MLFSSPDSLPLPHGIQLTPSRSVLKNKDTPSRSSSSSFRVKFAEAVMHSGHSYHDMTSNHYTSSDFDLPFVSINSFDSEFVQAAVLLPTPINRARPPACSDRLQYSRLRMKHASECPQESLPWVLGCMVYQTLLGKWGLLVIFLGLIGMVWATQNTALLYSAATMVLAGAAAIGVSLFHSHRIRSASAEHLEQTEILRVGPEWEPISGPVLT